MIKVSTKGEKSLEKNPTINICDEDHSVIRKRMVEIGRNASIWISDYFLQSDSVFVPNRDNFKEIISEWQYDPCTNESLSYYS